MTEVQKSAIRIIDSMVANSTDPEFCNLFIVWSRIMNERLNGQTRSNQNNQQPDKR
jgi:hypothetical protein